MACRGGCIYARPVLPGLTHLNRTKKYGCLLPTEVRCVNQLEPPAGLHAVEIAVDVELEQNRGLVTGAPRRHWLGTVKPKLDQIERIDEHIDRAHRIILVDPILKAHRQQGRLPAIHPFNEPRHPSPADSARES